MFATSHNVAFAAKRWSASMQMVSYSSAIATLNSQSPWPCSRSPSKAAEPPDGLRIAATTVARSHEQISHPSVPDGILDRLLHIAHRMEMRGDSMRKNRPKGTA
jgi:hypothetical protein